MTEDQRLDLFAEFVQKWNIKHSVASAEHPQTNGLVEKINRALAETLVAFLNTTHTDWDVKMDQALFAINSVKQSTVLFRLTSWYTEDLLLFLLTTSFL